MPKEKKPPNLDLINEMTELTLCQTITLKAQGVKDEAVRACRSEPGPTKITLIFQRKEVDT
jgi:hypothetical protein